MVIKIFKLFILIIYFLGNIFKKIIEIIIFIPMQLKKLIDLKFFHRIIKMFKALIQTIHFHIH